MTAGLALILAASAVQAAPKSTITKVTATDVSGGVEIAVVGENLSAPKTFFANNNSLYIVQFNAVLVPNPGSFRVDREGVGNVRYVRYQPNPNPVSRLTIEVKNGTTPKVTQEDGTWYIRVGEVTKAATTKSPTIDSDQEAMRRAVEQLKYQPTLAAKPESTKSFFDANGNPMAPGTILGSTPTASFKSDQFSTAYSTMPAPTTSPFGDATVMLSTDRADVLMILKTFAAQTDVNIIVAPNVSPADKPLLLSVNLNDVDLDFAMTTVASLAGLRFTRIGNTYVVCNSGDFNTMVGNIWAQSGVKFASRVVDLTSGEARQIRDATMQALPQDGPDGYYEVFDPTDAVRYGNNLTGGANTTGGATTGAEGANVQGGTTPPTNGAAPSNRAKYVTLVGEPRRLDVIEAFIRDLDTRIAKSFSLSNAANFGSVVVPIMSGQTQKIKDMLNKLLEQNPRRTDYSIEESSVKELADNDDSQMMLLIAGPKEELEYLRVFADQMDASMCELKGIERNTDPESFRQMYEVVDLKHIEPNHAAYDLKSRVRGLYVSILPDPVTPGLKGEEKDQKAVGGDATAATGAGAQQSNSDTAEMTRQIGHEQMRLVLRGTRAQIDEAKLYLSQVDQPARQVAIELRVMELTRFEALKIGLDWSVLTGGRLTSLRMNQGVAPNISQGGNFSGTYQDNATTSFDVLGQLDAISNRNNLIARPNALITDGRSTHLFVGDTIRYIKLINASQNGTTVEVGEVEVGVTVDVQARIGADGNIALDLTQNFSLLTAFTPVPGGGQIPQTSDRKTSMFVNLRSGETLALGGLILEQDRKSVSGIPILRDLPIIGHLFSRTDNRKEKTEIVFFLTAKTVDNDNKANAANPKRADGN